MNTPHQRSYEFEPIVIGRGLDEFACEDTWRPSTFDMEDSSNGLTATLQAFESEIAAASVATVSPVTLMAPAKASAIALVTERCRRCAAAVRIAGPRARLAISTAVSMIAVAASVMAALIAAWVFGATAAVRSTGQRCRLAISTALSMIAVAASVVAAWTAAWVLAAIALISRRIESGRAGRRIVRKPLDLHWVGASALRGRRSTVAAFSVPLLALVLAPSWNPPAVSPVAAVSTSTSLQAAIPTVEEANAIADHPLPAALPAERLTTIAPLKSPVVRAALRTAAPSAAAEARTPVLLAVAADDPPISTAAEPIPVPVAIVSATLEAPKPAAAEPAAHVPSAVGPAPDAVTADRVAINDVLVAYRRSFNSLDAGAVAAIWRGADTQALARAFSTLTRQHMTFDRCDVRVTAADSARARCDGLLSYVQKAGDSTPQQRRVSWSMDLGRRDDRWEIVGVQAR